MTTNNQQMGLRPVRSKTGKVEIREVYYDMAGNITMIENSFAWPYKEDDVANIKTLSQMYPLLEQQNKYNPNIIDYNHKCSKWDFMSDDQFEQHQQEEQQLREAEAKAELIEQEEDNLAALNEQLNTQETVEEE
tara:strand:- start:256 stop:657 length:402 start_codon:yes stop_codon:yes gene_type:complete